MRLPDLKMRVTQVTSLNQLTALNRPDSKSNESVRLENIQASFVNESEMTVLDIFSLMESEIIVTDAKDKKKITDFSKLETVTNQKKMFIFKNF